MLNKTCLWVRQHYALSALIVIIALGMFLRAYHFGDWLHFELDQSRDAKIVDLAIKEGPSNLPLLGPKAAGTFLRLGPLFYYFKYLSALVFGNTPSGMAVIVMIFGILAIPFFYLFIKRYFDEKISLGLALVFSVSIFLVMYSRFSWNPNPLPLFTLLTFYFLLRAVDATEKKQGLWLLAMAVSLAIATQMHFLAFVAVPAITFIYLVIKRPRIKLGYWIGAALIIVFLYSPAIANDFMTGGDNISQFLSVAEGKSTKNTRNILEKAIKDYEENSLGHFLIVSGLSSGELPRADIGRTRLGMVCDSGCQKNAGLGILAVIIFTLGILLLMKNLRDEKEQRRRDFLILVGVWFVVCFGLFVPLSFDISPRFFLLLSAIPFIFIGFILEFITRKFPKGYALIYLAIFLLTFSNLWAIKQRFWEMKNAPYQSFEIQPDRILKEKTRVTLEQQDLVINYIESIYSQNKYPVFMSSDPFYRRSLVYGLDNKGIFNDDFKEATSSSKVYVHGNYFLVLPTLSNIQGDIMKYSPSYDVKDTKKFGTLSVITLSPKPEAINADDPKINSKDKSKTQSGAPERFKWEEIFNDSSGDESAVDN